MLKCQEDNDYQRYMEVSIDDIDPFGSVPELELETPDPDNVDDRENKDLNTTPDNQWQTQDARRKDSKKRKNSSPIQQERKKKREEYTPRLMAQRIEEYLTGTRINLLEGDFEANNFFFKLIKKNENKNLTSQ